jgi:hypothetical protein
MMQPREQKLAGAIAGLLVLMGGWTLWGYWSTRVSDRTSQIDRLEGEISAKKKQVVQGAIAAKKLADWEARSLPKDKEQARSLYQNWLIGLIERAKFTNADLSTQSTAARQKVFDKLAFTITADATLDQLVQFLFEFYKAGHLDQIRRLQIQPVEKSPRLKLNLAVEGLILPSSKNAEKLSTEPGKRLALDDLKKYQEPIAKRNFFAEYTPPPAVAKATPKVEKPTFDPASQAKFTGYTEVGDKRQAWVRVFTTNQTLLLGEGDKLEVGTFKGTVTRVEPRSMELTSGGKRWMLPMGESLKDAVAIGDDQAAVPDKTATE